MVDKYFSITFKFDKARFNHRLYVPLLYRQYKHTNMQSNDWYKTNIE